jgi:Mor family transcriptional regulator
MPCAIDKIRSILLARGVPCDTAATICAEIGSAIGGRRVYIGMRSQSACFARNAEIAALFTGNNHRHLAEQYGVSKARVYQILKTQKARKTAAPSQGQ